LPIYGHVCETNELKIEENNEIKEMERKPKNDCNIDFLVLNGTIMRVLAIVCLLCYCCC
jgi:hypothetical protein